MMKKRLLLSIFVASVFAISALGLNSCNKNKAESNEEVPTVLTIVRNSGDWAACDHCTDRLWDRDFYCFSPEGPQWDTLDPRVYHVHEYQAGDSCMLEIIGKHCRYNKLHHKHILWYTTHWVNGQDHVQDDWIHIGGEGEGN